LLYVVLGLLLIAGIFWLATGRYSVQPGERAALLTFGKYSQHGDSTLLGGTGPGLHWWWPSPIGTRFIVDVQTRRRLELGFRGNTTFPEESLMITGDENIVDAELLVQYDVKDIEQFLFKVVSPDGATIKDAAETSLRQVVGSRNIDDVLTIEKEAVQADTKEQLQELLDAYEAGIRIVEVKLQNVNPPAQVQDAFDDVVRAREDKETIINLADAYEESVLPRARGDAERLKQEAEGFAAQRVNIAKGQAERFTAILAEYNKAKGVTRQRMYLEAMEEILPGISKLILDPDINTIVLSTNSGGSTIVPVPSTGQTQPQGPAQ